MSGYEASSSLIFVILNMASQLKPVRSSNDWTYNLTWTNNHSYIHKGKIVFV